MGRISGMQTWLALPDGAEEIDAAFEHVSADALPVVEDGGARATVIMGSLWGERSPVTQHAASIYADIALKAGGSLPVPTDADERALLLAEGEASLDGQPMELFQLYLLAPGHAPTLRAGTASHLMLLGGEAFASGRHVWWNFVSSRRERIEQAKQDWRAGRFGAVPGDEEEYIPLPEKPPKTVSYP